MKLFVAVQQQQIFHINNADYIICRIFINRDSRIPLFAVNFQKLVICVIHLGKRHIYSWHHNIFRQTFAKIKHIRNHLLFFCFQNALFMAYFNNGTKFIFGNRLPFLPVCFQPSAIFRIRILFTVTSAVSEEEKNADRAKRINKISNCMTASPDGSIIKPLL